jgi:hypothetical protein
MSTSKASSGFEIKKSVASAEVKNKIRPNAIMPMNIQSNASISIHSFSEKELQT